jgi:hypothetical protein
MKLAQKLFILFLKVASINLNHMNSVESISARENFHELMAKNEKTADIQALADSIQVLFIDQGISFEFYIFGRMTAEMGDIIDGVRQKISMEPLTIGSEDKEFVFPVDSLLAIDTNISAIIFYNFNKYKIYEKDISARTIDPQKFLVYLCCNVSSTDNIQIQNQQFQLINFVDRDEIVLKTVDVNQTCSVDYKVINSFEKTSLKWKNKLEDYKWLKNYFGCTVFVTAKQEYASLDFLSLPYEVSKMVGKRLNFTVAECDEKRRVLEDKRLKIITGAYNTLMHDLYGIELFYQNFDEIFGKIL